MCISCGISPSSLWAIHKHRLLMHEFEEKGDCYGTALSVAHHLRYNCSHGTAHRLWTAYDYRHDSYNYTLTQCHKHSYTYSQSWPGDITCRCAILPLERYDHCNPEQSEQPDHLLSRSSDELLGYTPATTKRSASNKRRRAIC